ncbi:PilW family protein [Pseudoduganella sp. R-31]|uniref:PilW family protein n=1 Tax=Pseudoduganella sp. R-31 TaxID=3404060 RepID=UPI003CE6B1BD
MMQSSQRGFTMVEIMVGLVVGMLGTLIVAQAFTNNEARKRTTTSGGDAQANGAIALYMLERDTKMAGWGMTASPKSYVGCSNIFAYCDKSADCGGKEGALTDVNFAPALIKDGGDGPDSISVQYFADPSQSSYQPSGSTTIRRAMPQPSAELDVGNAAVCQDGDLALVSQAGNCTIMKITEVQAQASKLQHNSGAGGSYNPPASYFESGANAWPKYPAGASVTCFKPANGHPIFRKTYSVNTATKQLERSDNSQAPAVTNELVMSEVVDMQAEYGVAPAGSQTIDTWVSAASSPWKEPSWSDWQRIKAIRVAMVTRGVQYERPKSVDKGCTATTALSSSWAAFKTDKYPSDWSCYRYRVFETVIPLRNVIWGKI